MRLSPQHHLLRPAPAATPTPCTLRAQPSPVTHTPLTFGNLAKLPPAQCRHIAHAARGRKPKQDSALPTLPTQNKADDFDEDLIGLGEDEELDDDEPRSLSPDVSEAVVDDIYDDDDYEAPQDAVTILPAVPTVARPGLQMVSADDYEKEQKAVVGSNVMSLAEYEALFGKAETPEEEKRREDSAREASTSVAVPEASRLALNRQGFQSFEMDGLELLVAETTDGKLNLSDSYIFEGHSDMYARPTFSGTIPQEPALFQCIPWFNRVSADSIKKKKAANKMLKVVFVGLESKTPYRLSLEDVFMFDVNSRSLTKEIVKTIGQDFRDPILRIRPDGITIEDSGAAPPPVSISMNISKKPAEELSAEEYKQKMEELEQEDFMDDFDELPDAPAVDMM